MNILKEFGSHGDGSYMFGPCVRDSIAGRGEHSPVIDICVPNEQAKDTLIRKLSQTDWSPEKVTSFKSKGGTFRRFEFSAYDPDYGEDVTLNVHIPQPGVPMQNVVGARYGSDVNRIMEFSNGGKAAFNCDLNKAISNCKRGQFAEVEPISDKERGTLDMDGFSPAKNVVDKANTRGTMNASTTTRTATLKEKPVMEKSLMDMVKADMESAAYRVAATQITNGVKAGILAVMEKQGAGSDRIKAVSDIMDTEFGSALIAAAIGMGLTYAPVPVIKEDARAQRLATEFRVHGVATAGNAVVGVAIEHFLPVVMNALAALPQPAQAEEKVRLGAPPAETTQEEEQEDEQENEMAAPKKMTA